MAGCTGDIADPFATEDEFDEFERGGTGRGGESPGETGETLHCDALPPRLRRLAPTQLDRALAPLLPDSVKPSAEYTDTLQLATRFTGEAGTLGMTTPHVEDLLNTMGEISDEVVTRIVDEVGCAGANSVLADFSSPRDGARTGYGRYAGAFPDNTTVFLPAGPIGFFTDPPTHVSQQPVIDGPHSGAQSNSVADPQRVIGLKLDSVLVAGSSHTLHFASYAMDLSTVGSDRLHAPGYFYVFGIQTETETPAEDAYVDSNAIAMLPGVDFLARSELIDNRDWEYKSIAFEATADYDRLLLVPTNQAVADGMGPGESGSYLTIDSIRIESGVECNALIIETLVGHLFRRPATAEETDRYVSLLNENTEEFGSEEALKMVTEVLLMSPNTLYRSEVGDGEKLTHYEIASAISFAISDGPPDAQLLAAAEDELLYDSAERERHARRLLEAAESGESVQRFFSEYLHSESAKVVAKNAELFPDLTDEIRDAMVEEQRRFIAHVLWEEGGTYEAIMSAPYTVVSPELAAFYGFPTEHEEGWVKVDTEGRAGALMHGAYLLQAGHDDTTSVVLRSVELQTELLCATIPDPPPDIDDDLPREDPSGPTTQRDRLEEHRASAVCASCHDYIDPTGYPFEAFDPMGRAREEEQGLPIDTTGQLFLADGSQRVDNAVELVSAIATAPQAQECFAEHLIHFMDGEERDDDCIAFDPSGDIREMLVRHVASERFIERSAIPGADLGEATDAADEGEE